MACFVCKIQPDRGLGCPERERDAIRPSKKIRREFIISRYASNCCGEILSDGVFNHLYETFFQCVAILYENVVVEYYFRNNFNQ